MHEEILSSVLESMDEGVYLVDRERRITYWNDAATRITGYSQKQVIGLKCSDNILRHIDSKGKELCVDGCPLEACMKDGRRRMMEVFLHHADGHRVPVLVRAIPIPADASNPSVCIEIFSDRSERSSLISELKERRKESLTDQLTGLGNRRYADSILDRAFVNRLPDEEPFGIFMIDIDHFKNINDEYGHQSGDRILRMVAWTLTNALRRIDSASRWGGEEFLVMAPGIEQNELVEMGERLRVLISSCWISLGDGRKVSVTVSVGGAMARATDTAASIITRADERLYMCKAAGRNRCDIGD
jgi:diguanylate cyclase (GGDEF)-like protein/PAS domain S-box-containing protein